MKGQEKIRRSTIAGSWYPGTADQLARTVDTYLDNVEKEEVEGELVGLISPHAGYAYSGQVAAYAYKQLEDKRLDTVVLMGPSHRAYVGDYAVSAESHYETPLGLIELDRDFIERLRAEIDLPLVERDPEHSLEIQLPFMQRVLGQFRLVPIMMSTDSVEACRTLGQALAKLWSEGHTLLVASTDLHHINNYDEVVRRDRAVVEAVESYDLDRITQLLLTPGCSVCGRMPVITLLLAGENLGANAVKVLHYTNSGDVTGNRLPGSYTVGYMAAAIYRA
ncbi:MAG: AmmeMemoRadiSam system protein B [Anaerolineae bacterium]